MSIGRSLGLFISGTALLALAGCGDMGDDYHAYSEPAAEPRAADPELPVPADDAEQPMATDVVEEPASSDIEAPDLVALDIVSVDPRLDTSGTMLGFAEAVSRDPETALIAAAEPDSSTEGVAEETRKIEVLVPENDFRKEGPDGALRVTYDDLDLLKTLNMDPVVANAPDYFPGWLAGLEGQRIRLRGYMRPGPLSKDIPFFVLARDTQACCFGPNTKAYDIIPTLLRQGVTTEYIHLRPFDVVGVFHVNIEMDLDDESKVEFLYFIDDAVVIQN